jgi:hypothetical protein
VAGDGEAAGQPEDEPGHAERPRDGAAGNGRDGHRPGTVGERAVTGEQDVEVWGEREDRAGQDERREHGRGGGAASGRASPHL